MSNYQNNNNSNVNGDRKKDKIRLEVDPIPFDGELKTKRTTTIDLGKSINGIFRRALHDFYGCLFSSTSRGDLVLNLYFTDQGRPAPGSIKVLKDARRAADPHNVADMIFKMDNFSYQKTYELTEEAKEILSDFIYVPNGAPIDWNARTEEVYTRPFYPGSKEQIIFVVKGLDLGRILKTMYKNDDSSSHPDYQIKVLRPMNEVNNQQQNNPNAPYPQQRVEDNNYIIDIVQLDAKRAHEIAEEIGIVPHIGSLRVIR